MSDTPLRSIAVAVVSFALMAPIAEAGCGGGSNGGSVVVSTSCTTDFNCPPDQTCDVKAEMCVDGVAQDNHLMGQVQFILGALVPADAGPNTGAVAVSGSLGGQRLEISAATAGNIDASDPALIDVALQGETTNDHLVLGFYLPTAIAARTGPFVIDPYASYATDDHAYFFITKTVGAHPDPTTDPFVAYSVAGTGSITAAATRDGQTLSMTLDATLQAPGAVRPCVSTCTSQADCGAVAGGTEGVDYPQCFEEWDGGPKLCDAWQCGVTGTAACGAAGGTCVNALCLQPLCSNLVPGSECATLTQQNCSVCCNERSQGGQVTFNRLLYETCGCQSGAACESQCSAACGDDPSGSIACSNCVESSDACISSVVKACAGHADCNAFLGCQQGCP
jgi:hypothetical protein